MSIAGVVRVAARYAGPRCWDKTRGMSFSRHRRRRRVRCLPPALSPQLTAAAIVTAPTGQPPSDGEGAPNRGRGRGGGDLLAPFFAGTEAAPVTPASIVFLVSDKTPFPFLLPAPAAERIFTAPSPSPYPRPGNGVCTLAWRVSQEGQAGRCIYTPLPIGPSDCSTT